LTSAYPELKDIHFDRGQFGLPSLLEKVGERVQSLFRDFPNTSSIEEVRSEILNQLGTPVRSMTRKFQYLMIARAADPAVPEAARTADQVEVSRPSSSADLDMLIEEFRTDLKGRDVDILKWAGAYMLTKGFVSIPLFLHPLYQRELATRYLGQETGRHKAHVIAFAQQPAVATLRGTFVSTTGEPIRFYLQGIVWVDPEDFEILRIRTDLLPTEPSGDLLQATTQVELEEVPLPGLDRTLRLPHRVEVNTRWVGRSFKRNRHHYSDYRLFSVQSIGTRPEIKRP
jgi:hypothetical protein